MADADFPALGFDPSPGMPAEVQRLSSSLDTAVTKLSTAHDLMKQVATAEGIWEGEAADEFKNTVGEMPKHLGNAEKSLRDAAKLLKNWYDQLTGFDNTADRYEEEAKRAQQAVNQAEQAHNSAKNNPDLNLKGQKFSNEELPEMQRRYNAAVNQLEEAKGKLATAQGNFDEIIRKARKLLDTHDTEANATARQIKGAADDLAPPEPGFWEKVGDVFEWIWNHLGDIAAVVGAVAGILALLCTGPFAAVVAIVAVAASVVAFSKHLARDWEKINQWPPNWGAVAGLAGDLAGTIPGLGAAGQLLKGGRALSFGGRLMSYGDEMAMAAKNASMGMQALSIKLGLFGAVGGTAGMVFSDNQGLSNANAVGAAGGAAAGFGPPVVQGIGYLARMAR